MEGGDMDGENGYTEIDCPECGQPIALEGYPAGMGFNCPGCDCEMMLEDASPDDVCPPQFPLSPESAPLKPTIAPHNPTTPPLKAKPGPLSVCSVSAGITFLLGMVLMLSSGWLFVLYGPLFFAAFVLSILSITQGQKAVGITVLVASLILPTIIFNVKASKALEPTLAALEKQTAQMEAGTREMEQMAKEMETMTEQLFGTPKTPDNKALSPQARVYISLTYHELNKSWSQQVAAAHLSETDTAGRRGLIMKNLRMDFEKAYLGKWIRWSGGAVVDVNKDILGRTYTCRVDFLDQPYGNYQVKFPVSEQSVLKLKQGQTLQIGGRIRSVKMSSNLSVTLDTVKHVIVSE
jgi:hypothetical protein